MNPMVYVLYMCMLPSNLPIRLAFERWSALEERGLLDCEIEAMSFSKSCTAHVKYIYQEEEDWALLSGMSLIKFLSKYAGTRRNK